MKRILLSTVFLLLSAFSLKLQAQAVQVSVTPQSQCSNASNFYTVDAGIFVPVPTAISYTWGIASNNGCVATYTNGQHSTGINPAFTGSQIAITSTCCGIFTITIVPLASVTPPIPIPNAITSQTFEIVCPSSSSVAVSNTAICLGDNVVFTGTGPGASANSYTWSNGFIGNPVILTPSVNTCLTYTATSAQNCTFSPTSAGCASVQAISATVTPASQTICAGAPICLNVVASVTTGSNVLPGTVITNTAWLNPLGLPIASSCTTNAVAGTYSTIITHTGVAGTCNYTATASVATSNSISVTASASSPSVCPNATVSLLAASVQTAIASYTWSIPNTPAPTISITGNPIVVTNSLATLGSAAIYTVDTDYFGCPGTATVSVGMLTITPVLTPNSFSVCPNTAVNFTATGGTDYTVAYWNNCIGTPTSAVIGTLSATSNTFVHTPTNTACWPTQFYSVSSFSNGCTGTSTIAVSQRTIFPTLSSPTPSSCPGRSFALIAGNVGAGANFTFSATYSANIGSPNDTIGHTPPVTSPLPQTYTVVVDSAGCTGSATLTITEKILYPQISLSSNSVCPGTAVTLSVSGGFDTMDTLVGPFAGSPAPLFLAAQATSTQTPFTFTPALAPGLPYTYTLSADSAGCKGTATVQIGKLDLGPNITLIPSSTSICLNTQFTLTATNAAATPSNYAYTFVAPGGSTLTTTTVNIATPQPTALAATYTVYADSAGCIGSKTITIVERVLNPIIVTNNTLVCKNTPISMSITNVGYSSSNSYQFGMISPSLAVIPSGGTTFSFTSHTPAFPLLSPTATPIVYTAVVDSAGCKSSTISPPTLTVNFRPDLVLTPSSTAASVCPGTAATLAATGPTNVTWPITYTWTQASGSGNITPPTVNDSVQVFPFTNSTYSVSASDNFGCIGATVIAVGIDPTISFPVALSSSGSTICPGQSVTLTATSTITTFGNLSYSWTPVSTSLTPMNAVTVAVSPTTTTTYTAIVANQYGCVSGNTITVPMGSFPSTVNAIAATYTAVCAGFTSTLTGFGAQSYTWTGSTTYTAGVAQQSVSVPMGTYTLTMSNGGSCISTRTITIDSMPPIPIFISASSQTTCIESNFPKFSKPVKLTASGAANYVWQPYNPLNMTYSLGAQTDVRPSATTIYTVTGSTPNCANTATFVLTVIPQFTLKVVPPLPAMCLGDSLKLIIAETGTNAVGPVSKFTYSWTEPGNAPPISLSNNLTPTVMAFPQNTATYTVEVKDARACISFPRLTTVTVLPRPLTSVAIPTINSLATNTLCYVGLNPGAPDVTLELQAVNGNTTLPFGVVPTYTWLQPYNIKYNSVLTSSTLAGVIINAPLKLPAVVVYTVVSGYNGILGCQRMDTVSVRVVDCRPVRSVTFTTTEVNDTICSRDCITFLNLTDTMAGGPQKLIWQFPGGSPSTSTLQIPTVCYNLPGKYNVILGVSNPYPIASGGSSLTMGQLSYVKVVDYPNVMIVAPGQERSDTTIRFGTPVKLNGSGALTYEWSPNYNITSLTNPSVTVNPFKTVQYVLKGYNSKKCASSDTINVIVIEDCGEMYVPNAFSPNNDGANDVLYVRGICLESLTFMVFDRWGEKVFETNDQRVGWDGTYKGQLMNSGVFVFRLEGKTYDGKGYSLKGNITLLR